MHHIVFIDCKILFRNIQDKREEAPFCKKVNKPFVFLFSHFKILPLILFVNKKISYPLFSLFFMNISNICTNHLNNR